MDHKQLLFFIRTFVIMLILFGLFRGIFILVILILLSLSMSYIVNNFELRQIGFELVTFIAVLTGQKYGPWIALVITFVLITYHLLAGGFYGPYVLWTIPVWSTAAVVSGFLPNSNIIGAGISTTLAINATNIFFTSISNPGFLPKYMVYVITNIIFNLLLFTLLAKPIFFLMIN